MAIFLFFTAIALGAASDALVVQTKYGSLESTHVQPDNTNLSCPAFLGVPYAKPPVDQLRFRKPESPNHWEGVKQAIKHGPDCIQLLKIGSDNPAGESEDCLYLDIVLPSTENIENRKYPVMVWIHGGAFLVGSSYQFNSAEICRNLASKDVIVVSIQYRLGYLGFFTTGDANSKGNWGLHDQIAALKWVHENIESFGGDSNRVTIFGESAGGVSVSLLTYVQEAQPYFQQAIAQSGSAYTYWGLNDRSEHSSERFLKAAGCNLDDKVACLRSKSLKELEKIHKKEFGNALFASESTPGQKLAGGGHGIFEALSFMWAPRFDGDLIGDKLEVLAAQVSPKPYIIGATKSESLSFLRPVPSMLGVWKMLKNVNPKPTKQFFIGNDKELDLNTVLAAIKTAISIYSAPASEKAVFQPSSDPVLEKLATHVYLEMQGSIENKTYLTEQFLKLTADIWVNLPVLFDAHLKKAAGSKVWLYSFDYIKSSAFPKNWPYKGAAHAAELDFLFTVFSKVFSTSLNQEDQEMRDVICKMWTNYAKHGQPANSEVWPQFDTIGNPVHLQINHPIKISSDFHRKTLQFWASVLPSLAERDRKAHKEL